MTDQSHLTNKLKKAVQNLNSNNSKVVPIGCKQPIDITPDKVLESAYEKMESVVLMGTDKDGGYYFCSSLTSADQVLWLLEKFKNILLSSVDSECMPED